MLWGVVLAGVAHGRLFTVPGALAPPRGTVANLPGLLDRAQAPHRSSALPLSRSCGAAVGAAVGVATAAAAAAAAKAKVLNRRCTIAGSAAARSSSSRFLQRNLAPDLKGAFHFDPLGLASVEPELKIHPAALVAVVASTFPADVSAAVPSYVSQGAGRGGVTSRSRGRGAVLLRRERRCVLASLEPPSGPRLWH